MKRVICGLAILTLFLVGAGPASAEILYVTSLTSAQILIADTSSNAVTPVFHTVGPPDSLIFDTSGNIIYTNLSDGQVRTYSPKTQMDTLIAGGFTNPADLALEPGGGSFLMSDFSGGKIYRINLTSHAPVLLGNYGGNPQGMAFDGGGHLFANLGTRSGFPTAFLAQLNPVTGAILRQTVSLTALDGLTYDPFSKKLYDTTNNGNGIYQIDPMTLQVSLLPNTALGLGFDGITTDSAGNLYIAGQPGQIYQYNLISNVLTPETPVPGLDDLAPASGLGSPTPEPSSLLLLGTGMTGLAGFIGRRKKPLSSS